MIANKTVKLVRTSMELVSELREAMRESYNEHREFLVWAKSNPSYKEVADNMQNAITNFENKQEELRFIVQRINDSRIVGCAGLHIRNMEIPYLEVGYWSRTRDAGKGYITEAVKMLELYAITEFSVKRLEVKMAASNTASKRVAEKAGFDYEATIQSDRLLPTGKIDSTHIYCKTF